MKFKNTEYGDLTNQSIKNSINVKSKFLTSLEGCPEKIQGYFTCENNELTSLKGRPKYLTGTFNCTKNKNLKNVKEQIIKNQIKAFSYYTDEGEFTFHKIKEEFEEYGKKLEKEKNKKESEMLLEKKKKIKSQINKKDYGLSI